MLTSPARVALGLVSFVVAGSLLAGCSDDPEPAPTSSSPSASSTGSRQPVAEHERADAHGAERVADAHRAHRSRRSSAPPAPTPSRRSPGTPSAP